MNYNIGDQVIIKDNKCKLYGTIIEINNDMITVRTMFGYKLVTVNEISEEDDKKIMEFIKIMNRMGIEFI